MEQFDAIVIGAGQGGVPLAKAFATAGFKTAIIERAAVGGTCINYGCTPTKTLVHIAKVAQTVRRASEYGIEASQPLVRMPMVRELKRAIVEDFRAGTEKGLLETKNLELVCGHARFAAPHEIEVGSRRLRADRIVINTGARPTILPIEGLDKVPFLDNRTLMELDVLPESLVILGGGYLGLEFGQMFARFGSKVTIVEAGPRFMPREDEDVADEVAKVLREDGIDLLIGHKADKVEGDDRGVTLRLIGPDGPKTVTGSHLLVAVGRTPNTDDLNLPEAHVEMDHRGWIKVNSQLETTVSGIYAIGDVNGGPAFTHISYDDYRVLRDNLIDGKHRTTEVRPVPYVVFIDPELGRIGLTEAKAKEMGIAYRCARMPMTQVARAIEMNETRGFLKVLFDAEQMILGASVFGVEGGEIMSMIQLAMMGRLRLPDLQNAIFAHPTLSELLNNLVLE